MDNVITPPATQSKFEIERVRVGMKHHTKVCTVFRHGANTDGSNIKQGVTVVPQNLTP